MKKITVIFCVLSQLSSLMADESFFDKSEAKRGGFEKKLYYGLEKTDGLTPTQKEKINQALKEFQTKKEQDVFLNVKKFQRDDIKKEQLRSLASDDSKSEVAARAALLMGIHNTLNQKQREQFIKKFQGMID